MPVIFISDSQGGEWNAMRLTLLEQNSLQQGVLVPQHKTLIGCSAVILLKSLQAIFITLDGRLELTDILSATFTESRLRLSVALLTLLGGCIDLDKISKGTFIFFFLKKKRRGEKKKRKTEWQGTKGKVR